MQVEATNRDVHLIVDDRPSTCIAFIVAHVDTRNAYNSHSVSDFRAEYSAFWKCVQAGIAYMFTQLCKMLILATFFPTSDLSDSSFDLVGVRSSNMFHRNNRR